jgi:hypothetical protein
MEYEATPDKDIRSGFSVEILTQIHEIETKMLEFYKLLQTKAQGYDEWLIQQQGEISEEFIYRMASEIRQLHSNLNPGLSQKTDDTLEALENFLLEDITCDINKLANDMYDIATNTLAPLEASVLVMYVVNIVRDKTI